MGGGASERREAGDPERDRPLVPQAILCRILGNDLPPRHDPDQTLRNLAFILRHEPSYPGVEKHWIINRIVESDVERRVISMLSAHDQNYTRVAFSFEEYGRTAPMFSHFSEENFDDLLSGQYPEDYRRLLAQDHAFHEQNRYIMNVNGARNLALEHGRRRAKWVMPWDGNCYLTPDGWAAMRSAMNDDAGAKYLIVPMERILENERVLDADLRVDALEEPQIAFRHDALEAFDPDLRYGRYSKVELLRRLGVPGVWDAWDYQPWEGRAWTTSPEAGTWTNAGWVARLESGRREFDDDPTVVGIRQRSNARRLSIRQGIHGVDRAVAERSPAFTSGMGFHDPAKVERVRQAWREKDPAASRLVASIVRAADRAMTHPARSAPQKTELPASGDPRDYYSLAPFWWPNPATADGLPFVRRDGQRVPETDLRAPQSLKYDATRLQGVFDDVTALAWAHCFTGQDAYAAKALDGVRAWFLDDDSGMHPHLDYAQVRRGHANERGQATGIIDAKDIYLLLDAVSLLTELGAVPSREETAFRDWCRRYLDWLQSSASGSRERAAGNNHGTCFELQALSLSVYLGDSSSFVAGVNRCRARLVQQFTADGGQPHEAARTTSLHYGLFNMQSWCNVAQLARRGGFDLCLPGSTSRSLLETGIRRIAADVETWRRAAAAVEIWPPSLAGRLGRRRLEPLLQAGASLLGEAPTPVRARRGAGSSIHPYAGVPLFWELAFGTIGEANAPAGTSPAATPEACTVAGL